MIKINYEGECPEEAVKFLTSEARRITRENLRLFKYSVGKPSGNISIEQVMTGLGVVVGNYKEGDGVSIHREFLSERDYKSFPEEFRKDFKRTSSNHFWVISEEKIKQIARENGAINES